jgi:hypothetical protein
VIAGLLFLQDVATKNVYVSNGTHVWDLTFLIRAQGIKCNIMKAEQVHKDGINTPGRMLVVA